MTSYRIIQDKDFGNIPTFDHESSEIIGLFGKPYLDITTEINLELLDKANIEICLNLVNEQGFRWTFVGGETPPELAENTHPAQFEDKIYEVLGDTIHRENLKNFTTMQERRKYMYFAMNLGIPWQFSKYLLYNDFKHKTQNTGKWSEDISKFPVTRQFMETLPFEYIGRVVLYGSFPRSGVPVHRDRPISNELEHHINIFPKQNRPCFIYNTNAQEKIYLGEQTRAFIFNNSDYHGVDPESIFNYTLRIDGKFSDTFLNQIKNGE